MDVYKITNQVIYEYVSLQGKLSEPPYLFLSNLLPCFMFIKMVQMVDQTFFKYIIHKSIMVFRIYCNLVDGKTSSLSANE